MKKLLRSICVITISFSLMGCMPDVDNVDDAPGVNEEMNDIDGEDYV